MTEREVVHLLDAYTFLGRRGACAVTHNYLNCTSDPAKVTCRRCRDAAPSLLPQPHPPVGTCPHGDPTCPCPDSYGDPPVHDPCHYEAYDDSPAEACWSPDCTVSAEHLRVPLDAE